MSNKMYRKTSAIVAWALMVAAMSMSTVLARTIISHGCTGAQLTITATPQQAESLSTDEAQTIAQEAYVYVYPLVLMDLTRKQLTNADPKVNPIGGPANAFTHIRAFPDG